MLRQKELEAVELSLAGEGEWDREKIQGWGPNNATGQTNAIEIKNPVVNRHSWHLTLQLLCNLDILKLIFNLPYASFPWSLS